MYETEIIVINEVIFVDFDGQFNLRNEDLTLELLSRFKEPYYEKVESEIKRFLENRRDCMAALTDNIDLWIYGIYKKPDVIISITCYIQDSIELLQVFADETIKAEIIKKAFEYV